MFAARQRVSQMARQLPRVSRNYASDAHHGHHAPHTVNESFGTGSIAAVGVFFAGALVFSLSPSEGENSAIYNLINKYTSRNEDWEEINQAHSAAARQAGFDRNLFQYGGSGNRHVEVAYPEYVDRAPPVMTFFQRLTLQFFPTRALQSHGARNIRAGQLINIEKVVEHMRQEHLKEEEQKVKALALAQSKEE
ncbi:unnamed protein product [Clonostachys rhizophaga]|uniref:NADH-ubiquinone oxidoreductase 17.8 kDa subunit n=1 Tax=Clonostachys rhizophaga TaxID=160324 RepID=A0A9N9UZ87_9HYPO|nr:unnamed protein product [Clonostachys rhizophaga]